MNIVKFTCGGHGTTDACPFFNQQAETEDGESSAIAGANGSKKTIRVGFCMFRAPQMVTQPFQNPISGQMEIKTGRSWPSVTEKDYCGDHPAYRHGFAFKLAHAVMALWRNWIEYDPMKYPDTGFQRPPSLDEARAVATVPQSKDANLPESK